MKCSKSILASALLLVLAAFGASAAPAPEATPAEKLAALETPADLFGASILSGGDCGAAALRNVDTEGGDPYIYCGMCSHMPCRGLGIGDYCGHSTSGPKFCLDYYGGAVCPAQDGIRCQCAHTLP